MRENIIEENYSGGLFGNFGQDKTFAQVNSFYYWPKMQTDIIKFVEKCKVCQYTKGRSRNTRLY